MGYYTTMKTFFVDCYTNNVEQSQKIDKVLLRLSELCVCDFIKDIQKKYNDESIHHFVLLTKRKIC